MARNFIDSMLNGILYESKSESKNKYQDKNMLLFNAGVSYTILGVVIGISGIFNPLGSFVLCAGGGIAISKHFKDERRRKALEKEFDFWNQFGLINKKEEFPIIQECIHRNFGCTLRYSLPTGLSTMDFIRKEDALRQNFGADRLNIYYNNGFVFIDVYELKLNSFYEYEITNTNGGLELLIGKGFGYKTITVDLSKGHPHMLVGGSTGMGKTTFLRLALANLIFEGNKNIELQIADLKGTEFYMFKDIPMCEKFISDTDQAHEFIHDLYLEMNRRYREFQKKGVIDIDRYNKKSKKKMKRILMLVDEFQELEQKDHKEEIKNIKKLAAKGRSAGIHIILSTQRPSADILEGTIKNNLLNRVSFKLPDKLNSRIILDEEGAEELRKHGHGIFKSGLDKEEFQAMYMDEDLLLEKLKPYMRKKKKAKVIELRKDGASKENPLANIMKGEEDD